MVSGGAGTSGEKKALHAALERYRGVIDWKLEGLDDEQLRRPIVPSGAGLLSLVRHLTATETGAVCELFEPSVDPTAEAPPGFPRRALRVVADDDTMAVLESYRRARAEVDRIIDTLPLESVGQSHGTPVTLRSQVVRVIEDTARHAGQADIMRELIDGMTGSFRPVEQESAVVEMAALHPRVMFVCVSNAGKSRMAEALMKLKVGPRASVLSAGVRPTTAVNDFAARVVGEIGAEMSLDRPRKLESRMLRDADVIVLLGSDVDLKVPHGVRARVERWVIDEPAERGIEGVARMRLVRDDIEARVNALIEELGLDA